MQRKRKETVDMPVKPISAHDALLRLSALCSRSEQCCYDMERKMCQWKMSQEDIAEVMEKLLSAHFVDDRRYAEAYANDKMRYDRWGPRKIDQMLWSKHIPDDIRSEVLAAIDDEEWVSQLGTLLKSRMRSLSSLSPADRNRRLLRFAMGRGFSYAHFIRCIDTTEGLPEEDDY